MSEPQATDATGTAARDGSIGEQCDVCGRDVPADDVVKSEFTVLGAMCPTAMTFHTACYAQASAMWEQPDEDSYCTVDPLFPETGQWVLPEEVPRSQG